VHRLDDEPGHRSHRAGATTRSDARNKRVISPRSRMRPDSRCPRRSPRRAADHDNCRGGKGRGERSGTAASVSPPFRYSPSRRRRDDACRRSSFRDGRPDSCRRCRQT
jgi:hypothetical protein